MPPALRRTAALLALHDDAGDQSHAYAEKQKEIRAVDDAFIGCNNPFMKAL